MKPEEIKSYFSDYELYAGGENIDIDRIKEWNGYAPSTGGYLYRLIYKCPIIKERFYTVGWITDDFFEEIDTSAEKKDAWKLSIMERKYAELKQGDYYKERMKYGKSN